MFCLEFFTQPTSTEGHEEVEDGPRQDDDVVNVHPAGHDRRSVANA